MAAQTTDDDEEIVSINVTPLVDITLVLLIIFMVTATYIVKQSIEVDLPRAATGGETVGPTLTFTIDKAGVLYLDGQPASRPAARDAVRAALAKSKDARALIGADKGVAYGEVVSLIDLVKQEGLTKFAIQIAKDTTEAGR